DVSVHSSLAHRDLHSFPTRRSSDLFTASLRGRYPDLPRDVWCVQAGTAISRRVRHSKPNSFNRIEIGAERELVTIERWDYGAEEGRFQRVACFQPWKSSGSRPGEGLRTAVE